jgi:hypothetical protein
MNHDALDKVSDVGGSRGLAGQRLLRLGGGLGGGRKQNDLAAPILGPGGLSVARIDRTIFAKGDGLDAASSDAQTD